MDILKTLGIQLLNGWQLSRLSTFGVAARHESFALTADELAPTPSAVSHRINQLEEELGIRPFIRSHRKVELTRERKHAYWALESSLDGLNQEILDIKNRGPSGSLAVYSHPSVAQCWLVPALGDFTHRYPVISLTVLTGNDSANLQQAGTDLTIYFDGTSLSQLSHHFLMGEAIVSVCTPNYARQLQLTPDPASLRHCTLPHNRQAWSNSPGADEWSSWAQQFGIKLPQSLGIGFNRFGLAVIATMNHVGVAMGRRQLVQKRLENRELVAPFGDMTLKYHQHYYVATLPGHQWPKIDALIE